MGIRVSTSILLLAALAGCGGERGEPSAEAAVPEEPTIPEIVSKSIDFHGGERYDRARIGMTITSLSGSFRIEAWREDGLFEYVVTGRVGSDGTERRVRLTNDEVREWQEGVEVQLDTAGERRARSFVDQRVFFPLLPYTLKGGDIHFEDRGLETWDGRTLRRVKVTFTPGSSGGAEDAYTFWFDLETGRMEQFGYDFDGGLRFRKAVRFHEVGGLVFSDQENYAVDGERVPVDTLSPSYVAENMSLLSTVVLSDITVEPL